MPRRYDAVIFDLDGTLVDTETLCNAEALEALRVQGIEIDPGFFESLAGVHDARRIELIRDHIDQPLDAERFLEDWDARVDARLAPGLSLKTGAEGFFVAILPDRGIGVAVKAADGATRAAECAIAALLVRLGAAEAAHPDVAAFLNPKITNRRGLDVGEIRAAPGLLA